jgi:hypothetical protein
VNDVLLAAVTGGLRALLAGRGEDVDHLTLRATVPVSLHAQDREQAQANHDGMLIAGLPVHLADPARALAWIAADTSEQKHHVHPQPTGRIASSRLAQAALWRFMARQRWVNGYVANVAGPPVRLYLAGAPLTEVFPVVPLVGNIAVGVGALSYAGHFDVTAVADAAACPDLDVFVAGMRACLAALDVQTPADARAVARARTTSSNASSTTFTASLDRASVSSTGTSGSTSSASRISATS